MEASKCPLSPSHRTHETAPSAVTHSEDTSTPFLKFEIVFLVDDSTSTAGPEWQKATKALQAFADKVAKNNECGKITIQFLNSSEILTLKDPQELARRLENVALEPKSPIGTKLGKLLDMYIKCLKATRMNLNPAIFVVITDGVPTDGAQTEEAVARTDKALDKYNAKPEQISIQFVQIGKDAKATNYLRRLGGIFPSQAGISKVIVGTTPAEPGVELDLVKILADTVNRRTDQMDSAALIGGK